MKTNETYIVAIIPYIPQKVVEILKERGEKVEFKTKIQAFLEILPILEEEFNVVGKVFDPWYVNSKTLLEDTVGELKANARVVEGGRHVPVGEFPQGEYLVEYLGIPIKLLVVDDYKGYGGRCFVGYFRIIQKFINNYTEYYPWERVSTRGIGTSTTRTS